MSWLLSFGIALAVVFGFPIIVGVGLILLGVLEKFIGPDATAILCLVTLIAVAIHILA